MRAISKMKRYLVFVAAAAVLAASPVLAETLNLTTLPTTTANGYYVGALGGNITGGTSGNYYCIDFNSTSYVPSSFSVLVSSLSNISGTRFASATNALTKYQQVAWLMYEMQINPSQTAAIQFAMWSIFYSATPTYAGAAAWVDASTKINASDYDFSKVRIYTPTGGGNQEFMGGSVTLAAAPEPGEWALILLGLGVLGYALKRNLPKGNAVPIQA